MFEFILISRFLVDFLWEYKVLSALHVIVISYICLLYFFNNKKKIILCSSDYFVLLLFIFISFSFAESLSDESLIIYIKTVLFFIFYFVGRLLTPRFTSKNYLAIFSFLMILAFFFSSIAGIGYQYWGNVKTFSGGYFFKSDLALAVIIYMSLVFLFHDKKLILIISFICSLWLVIVSNSRVIVPMLVLIPFIIYSTKKHLTNLDFFNTLFKQLVLSFILVVLFFSLMSFILKENSYLGMDFNNVLSNSNTQGRSDIWQALITGFLKADHFQQLFGIGLDADKKLTYIYTVSLSLSGIEAHSSYLRILVSVGLIGSLVSIFLVISILKRALSIRTIICLPHQKILSLFFILIIVLLLTGLTIDSIIRPQIMLPLSLVSGLVVQLSQTMKSDNNEDSFLS